MIDFKEKLMKNLIAFTYVKGNGEISDRIAYVVAKPTDNYSMIDLTDLSDADRADIIARYEKLRKDMSAFYATVPFKYFKDKGISDIIELK